MCLLITYYVWRYFTYFRPHIQDKSRCLQSKQLKRLAYGFSLISFFDIKVEQSMGCRQALSVTVLPCWCFHRGLITAPQCPHPQVHHQQRNLMPYIIPHFIFFFWSIQFEPSLQFTCGDRWTISFLTTTPTTNITSQQSTLQAVSSIKRHPF